MTGCSTALALARAIEQARSKQSATFDSTRPAPSMRPLTTSRSSMAASAALGGSPKTPTSVTRPAIAVTYRGRQMTLSLITRTRPPAAACPSSELHKATRTVKTSVQTIPMATAMAAPTAGGVGLRMPATSGCQRKPCADASPRMSSTSLATAAGKTTTASAAPTAPAATGPGLLTTPSSGTQPMLIADARPQTSGKQSLAEIASS